jgi:hypothetical protein
METLTSGLTVTNTVPGLLNIFTTGVLPKSFSYGVWTNYSLSFVPLNYEQNMKILIAVPS